jgi:hypothetical protein
MKLLPPSFKFLLRLLGALVPLLLVAAAALPLAAHAADEAPATERVRIADPYIEIHTGPGRGYPVFHVAAREEWIEIFQRRTDWYRVRTDKGLEGWVHRRQLLTTLTEAGGNKTFRDVALDDYLARRAEMGGGLGRFRGEPLVKLWGAWRTSDTLSIEGAVGQVQGVFSGTSLWHVGVNAEPWSDKRWSPFFGIGLGKFNNIPNLSLVNAQPTNAKLAQATLGLRYYISERFVARLDYSLYTAFVADTRSLEYRAVSAGIGFFF